MQQPRLSIETDPAPTINLTFQQLQLPALLLERGTNVSRTCTFTGGPQFELFGAFSLVEIAAGDQLLEGPEMNQQIMSGVSDVINVSSPGVAFCRAVVDGRNITSQKVLFAGRWVRWMREKVELLNVPLTLGQPNEALT